MNSIPLSKAPADSGEIIKLIILISCVATIGGFLFGFDSGVINGTVDGLKQTFHSSSAGTGFEVASMLIGCAVGAFFAGRLADRWGRRAVLIISAVLFLLSAVGAGMANTSAVFIIARLLGGFAVGAASVMSPAYIAEVASARYRGRLATVQQIAIISGLFCAFLSNYLLAKAAAVAIVLSFVTIGPPLLLLLDDLQREASQRRVVSAARQPDSEPELKATIEKFRAEELEHRDIGLAHEAELTTGYQVLTSLIKAGSRAAIWAAQRF